MCFSPFNGWSLWIHFAVTCCWFSSKNLLTAMTQHLFITLRAAETVSCLPLRLKPACASGAEVVRTKVWSVLRWLGNCLKSVVYSSFIHSKHRGVNSPAVGDDQILFVSMLIPIDYKNYNVPNGKNTFTHTFLAFQKVHYLLTLNVLRPTSEEWEKLEKLNHLNVLLLVRVHFSVLWQCTKIDAKCRSLR